MGYGLIFSRFLEEDQIPWAEVRFLHALSEIPLPHGVIWHLHPLAENQASKAGAVVRFVSDARERRRVLVGCAEVTPRSFEHLRFHGGLAREHSPAREWGVCFRLTARERVLIAGLWGSLGASDYHHGVGDYPAFGFRASGDLYGKEVARVHLIGTEPLPDAAVSPLVDFDLPHPRGGTDLETGRGVVAICGRPAGVDSIETICRNP